MSVDPTQNLAISSIEYSPKSLAITCELGSRATLLCFFMEFNVVSMAFSIGVSYEMDTLRSILRNGWDEKFCTTFDRNLALGTISNVPSIDFTWLVLTSIPMIVPIVFSSIFIKSPILNFSCVRIITPAMVFASKSFRANPIPSPKNPMITPMSIPTMLKAIRDPTTSAPKYTALPSRRISSSFISYLEFAIILLMAIFFKMSAKNMKQKNTTIAMAHVAAAPRKSRNIFAFSATTMSPSAANAVSQKIIFN